MTQTFNTARRATNDEETVRRIMNEIAAYVQELDLDQTPADASNRAYELTREITGVADPYALEKRQSNDFLLARLSRIREMCTSSDDPLKSSIRLSIMGNIIDYGIGHRHDIEQSLATVLSDEFDIDDYEAFRKNISDGTHDILFLGDNAGEIVMDILFIEQLLNLGHRVVYVVKSGPVINDSTREDAEYVGMDKLVKVIETGSDGIGVQWSAVSDEFIEEYNRADIVVSKGQGNFETMDSINDKPILFLLKAKCELVAKELDVRFGGIVCSLRMSEVR